jgi:hypothetical protein
MALTQVQVGLGGNSNAPAFSAYASAGQTVANNTLTIVQLNTKVFDTSNSFNNTVSGNSYAFQPTVAGYYQISATIVYNSPGANGTCQAKISKNSAGDTNDNLTPLIAGQAGGVSVSALIYLNGTTDYIQFYTAQSTGSNLTNIGSSYYTFMTGCLVRAT